jgi:hypothetical protein
LSKAISKKLNHYCDEVKSLRNETRDEKHFLDTFFSDTCKQGDQVGRIFAYWVVVFLVKCFENYRCSTNFWATFFHGSSSVLYFRKFSRATFCAAFSQTHLVTQLANMLKTRKSNWKTTNLVFCWKQSILMSIFIDKLCI